MKNKFLLSLLAGSVLLSSCLKDEKVTDMVYGLEGVENIKIVEIHDGPDHTFSYDSDPNAADYEIFEVRLTAPAANDVVVTLEEDQALIDDYQTEHHTNYTKLPSNLYTLNGLSVTIPKGSISKKVTINMKTADLIVGGPFILGYKIKSATDPAYLVSGNYNSFVAVLGAKNKYDGSYSVESGTVTRYTAPGVPANDALSGSVAGNANVSLVTIGPNTFEIQGLQWAKNQGGVGGINNLRGTVDPATNLVTMFALGNATLANWAGHENKYDPATKTFHLAFRWNPTSTTREYEMVIKYSRPR